ncbi:DNA excision repair protein ERCC-6-like isoform X3 [Zophobas morio]|uniref:DNA excision repair protein ERCC-6-like isoform X3 n=1 Tax=Zophobas morio TaxID=2755281 RepID=UPI00308352BA
MEHGANYHHAIKREDKVLINNLINMSKKAELDEKYEDLIILYMKLISYANKLFLTNLLHKCEAKFKKALKKFKDYPDGSTVLPIDANRLQKLLPHQIEGIQFLFKLYNSRPAGGILADEMGLGKTVQVVNFIGALIKYKKAKYFLLTLPKMVLPQWKKEFYKWQSKLCIFDATQPNVSISLFLSSNEYAIVLVTYGLLCSRLEDFCPSDFIYDILICDEATKLKNAPSKVHQTLCKIPSLCRIGLTGTPIQNNLMEFWELFNFFSPGNLSSIRTDFRKEFSTPINKGREKSASEGEKLLGDTQLRVLSDLIQHRLLRRTKNETLPSGPSSSYLPAKHDLFVWIRMTSQQTLYYKKLLTEVHENLSGCPLAHIQKLKFAAFHPLLSSYHTGPHVSLENTILDDWDELLRSSGKLHFLSQFLPLLAREKRRPLIFCDTLIGLKLVSVLLRKLHLRHVSLQGDLPTKQREKLISTYNSQRKLFALLATTKLCGYGLNLVGADTVILCDLSWNPAEDDQAADRVYRYGQQREVLICRLVSCGSIEEKICRVQIIKAGLSAATLIKSASTVPKRYFSEEDLNIHFRLEDPETSTTLAALNAELSFLPDERDCVKTLEALEGVCGLVDRTRLLDEVDLSKLQSIAVKLDQEGPTSRFQVTQRIAALSSFSVRCVEKLNSSTSVLLENRLGVEEEKHVDASYEASGSTAIGRTNGHCSGFADERVEDLLPTLAQVSFKDASHVGDPPTTGAVVPSQARLSKSPFQGTRMTQKRQMVSFDWAINGLVKTTFSELNQIFQLPSDLSITWDKKLRSTAGTTLNKWTEEGVRTSTIQLNPRVIGSEEKLMETLAHELCHAAAWQFDGVSKPPHGQAFKKWAHRVRQTLPTVCVKTWHTFEVHYRYYYQCVNELCKERFGFQKKLAGNSQRSSCRVCGSSLEADF